MSTAHNNQATPLASAEATLAPAAAGPEATASVPAPSKAPSAQVGTTANGWPLSRWITLVPWQESVFPQGNALHWPGLIVALLFGLAAFSLMATDAQFRWGVPAGIVAIFGCALGILDFCGTFDDGKDHVRHRASPAALARPLLGVLGGLFAMLALVTLAVAGRLPIWASAVLIPAAFLALVAAVFHTGVVLGPFAVDETGAARPLLQRHGFWAVAVGTLLYLPMLGSYSLSDPWETHYGEVAREMLSRNDWISTWWAQDGWFWSKPVLDFWVQAIAMGVFGVHYQPGRMLEGAAHGHTPWPEWAIRMPCFTLTILALYFLYKGVSKVFGRRAGLLGAIVLSTMPQWYLLAHQSITDMPLVACLSSAMGLLILGMHTASDKEVDRYEVELLGRKLRFSAFHLVFLAVLAAILPQVLYLASRNLELVWSAGRHGFRPHLDEFSSGSFGNCSLPGNEACNKTHPAYVQDQPYLQGLAWFGAAIVLLFMNRGERRVQRLCFLGAWFFAAVATLGKGPLGFGLPVAVAFTYLATTRKWAKLASLEIVSGVLIIAAVALPWYVAMYIRHGQPFTDRLIFHDMWKRAMTHVHDTNEGDDVSFRYFIWQLGYALFPWTGLVPAGLVYWIRRRDDADEGRGDVSVFLAMWFVFAFALFTAMLTKFHHYIFPAVPPAAMLTGVLLDRILGPGPIAKPGQLARFLGLIGLSSVLGVLGTTFLFPGWLTGYRADPSVALPPHSSGVTAAGVALLAAGVALAIATLRGLGQAAPATGADDRDAWHENLLLGGVGIAAAIVVALVGRDMVWKTEANDVAGQARLIYLFTYNYRRPWPDTVEFTGTLAAFSLLATSLLLMFIVERWRRALVILTTAVALLWGAWGVDVYLVRAAPHWGQRELFEAYYRERGPNEPIAAFQMNWKGENFYTGNQIPAFVSSGQPFTSWISQQVEHGVHTIYFVTEHTRIGSLKSEASNPKAFDVVTDRRLNNKFALVRARY